MNRLDSIPTRRRRGFTMVELLVVIAMLMLLMGSVTSAIMSAQKRSKIAKATAAVQELTNAILSYENYTDDHNLSSVAIPSWQDVDESTISFLLGKESNRQGKIPVLYNADLKNGKLLDPWGKPYRVQIKPGTITMEDRGVLGSSARTHVAFPNFYRHLYQEDEL